MFGNNKLGFSLIELMVAIGILGLLATIVIPNLQKKPNTLRKNFITQLNNLVKFASNNALKTAKIHKVEFNLPNRNVSIKKEKNKGVFETIKKEYRKTSITIPKNIVIKNFFIDKTDEIARYSGNQKANTLWFFTFTNRFAQSVIINILDTIDTKNKKPKMFSLVLNPFSAQFKVYDRFKKP